MSLHRYRLPLLLLGAVWALLMPVLAQALEVVVKPGTVSVLAQEGVELLFEESGEKLTADQVMAPEMAARWKPHERSRINMPSSGQPVWARFDVRLDGPLDRDWLLAIEWVQIETIDLHQYDPATRQRVNLQEAGITRSHQLRAIKDPATGMPIAFDRAPKLTLLVRAQARGQLILPMRVWDAQHWQARRYDFAMGYGLLLGILGVMFFYNLSLYIFTREPSFRTYCGYLFSVIGYQLCVTGYGALYLWGHDNWLNRYGYPLFATASFFAATVFFRRFLDLAHEARHLNRMNQAFIVLWAVVLATAFINVPILTGALLALGMFLSGAAGIYTAAYLMWRGNVLARYILVAWSSIIVGTYITTFGMMGIIPSNDWVNAAQPIGFIVETVLLSIALAARIKRDRELKLAAERESRELAQKVQQERDEKLRAQEHALAVQLKANEELELRVIDRTAELKRAMENIELANRELAKLSVTDALTKVHNRRYFDETMKKEYDRSSRSGSPLALLLVDIDYFKKINDSVGHLGGDECLKLVAAALTMCVGRSTDLVARYGGEEFAVVLPGVDAAHAMDVAERIRKAVEDIQFIYRGRRVPVSVSLGVVARVADASRPLSEFIREADQALYGAKGAGRNRAMLAEAA